MQTNGHRSHRIVRRIYPPRIVGMGLGFLCVASVLCQQETHPAVWLMAITHGLIWPHIAYQIAKNSTRPYETEMRNLLIDSFMGGAWVPLIAFNWLPSFLIIIMTSMSNISAGGPAQFVKGIIGHLLGGIVAVMLFGFSFHPHPTMPVILLSLPTLVVYPVMIAMVAHRLSQQLSRQKKELQKTLAQVKTLSGLLPICASCKKIRDDKGYWNRIETYLHDHTDADFSHGICPECAANLYPGLYNREDSTGG